MLKCEMPQGVDDDRADGGEDSKGILCVRVRVREKKKKTPTRKSRKNLVLGKGLQRGGI